MKRRKPVAQRRDDVRRAHKHADKAIERKQLTEAGRISFVRGWLNKAFYS